MDIFQKRKEGRGLVLPGLIYDRPLLYTLHRREGTFRMGKELLIEGQPK